MIDYTTFNQNFANKGITKEKKLILVSTHILAFMLGGIIMHLHMNY
jgi:hypothetical protein